MKYCYGELLTKNPHYIEKFLNDHKAASCYVRIYDDGTIDFISYHTLVIRAVPVADRYSLECSGTYSATTTKQIGWFLKEYFPALCYYDMKNIAGTDKSIEASLDWRVSI